MSEETDELITYEETDMSDMASGVVEKVYLNERGYYSIKLDDGQWYGCGRDKPPVSEGNVIELEWEANGRFKNTIMETINVIDEGEAPAPKPRSNSGGGRGGYQRKAAPQRSAAPARSAGSGGAPSVGKQLATSKDEYWSKKEERDIEWQQRQQAVQVEIRQQASRNAAIELVTALIAKDALDLGKADGKKATPLEAALAYVSKVADGFFNETTEMYQHALFKVKMGDIPAELAAEQEADLGNSGSTFE